MLELTGLILIALGWAIQLVSQSKNIQPALLICYTLGVGLLAIQGFMAGAYTATGLNLVVAILAAGMAVKISS
jgi:hypothetical protein